jgi:hypothetical protein
LESRFAGLCSDIRRQISSLGMDKGLNAWMLQNR